ncbi:hypothetical protein BDQ17DRAFT_1344495 [Cyathus striatus]|nr:hypothetical protein BDQ17DRAFT_1344495 [Cyathus striatus]
MLRGFLIPHGSHLLFLLILLINSICIVRIFSLLILYQNYYGVLSLRLSPVINGCYLGGGSWAGCWIVGRGSVSRWLFLFLDTRRFLYSFRLCPIQ